MGLDSNATGTENRDRQTIKERVLNGMKPKATSCDFIAVRQVAEIKAINGNMGATRFAIVDRPPSIYVPPQS